MTTAQPIRPVATAPVWTGEHLLGALTFATRWLDHHRDRVNALNVFPIPDGDTGTNMALTMNASLDAALKADDPNNAGVVADRFAFGALMGARGNSGVILSQIFRGFATPLAGHEEISGEILAHALSAARDKAYKAVMRPVEGTILSVIRIASEDALEVATPKSAVSDVLAAALEGARRALDDTPNQLDILRQANVVDSGGQGLVYILDGMYRYSIGDITIDESTSNATLGAEMSFLDDVAELHGEDPFGYCTNFMVFGEGIDFEQARETIASMGQSVVAVGDDTMLKVHIHTENPGDVLTYALSLGYLDQIKIDNMTLQTEVLTTQRTEAKDTEHPAPIEVHGDTAVIAVAAGDGLANALSSMGADVIVRGGQTMNPSTEELMSAVESLPVGQVIILPNNKNIILAAGQVKDLTEKHVEVIPSKSLPQGLCALASFNRDSSFDENVTAMTEAIDNVDSIEITVAVRDVELDGVHVHNGEIIGIVNGKIIASGQDLGEVTRSALTSLREREPELITVFTGQEATEEATESLKDEAETLFPEAEIEVIEGDQPHYQYLIAVE